MSLVQATWDAYRDPLTNGWGETITHVKLSLAALAIAVVGGGALGIVCARLGRFASLVVVTVTNLGRTVPTFAIIALIAAAWTIGFWPAVIGLFALGIPPILLNVYTGLTTADRGAVEAARGMGLTRVQVLTRVELPIALPLVFAGVRTAAVQIVATATLAGTVGAGGLGTIILAGLSNQQTAVLLAGAIPVAILALLTEALFAGAERLLTPTGLRIQRRLANTQGRTA